MITYRRLIPPFELTGDAAAAARLALHKPYGLRNEEKKRQEAELVDWEEEGGSLAAAAVAPQSS